MQQIGINDWRNALLDTELSSSAKLVGVALAKYYRQEKPCFPSLMTLMAECSIKSKHTVIKAIDELKKSGMIKVKKGELRYVSSLQNYYEFVGVDDSANDSAINGATKGATNGATKGAINAPEIREEVNKGNNINISLVDFEKKFEEFWQAYTPIRCDGRVVDKGSKKTAKEKYINLLKKGTNHNDIINGLEKYIRHCQANNQLTCGATVFLNQERWRNDYDTTIPAGNPKADREDTGGEHQSSNSVVARYAQAAHNLGYI